MNNAPWADPHIITINLLKQEPLGEAFELRNPHHKNGMDYLQELIAIMQELLEVFTGQKREFTKYHKALKEAGIPVENYKCLVGIANHSNHHNYRKISCEKNAVRKHIAVALEFLGELIESPVGQCIFDEMIHVATDNLLELQTLFLSHLIEDTANEKDILRTKFNLGRVVMQLLGKSLFYHTYLATNLPKKDAKYRKYQDAYYWLKWAIRGHLKVKSNDKWLLDCCGKPHLEYLHSQRNILYHPIQHQEPFDIDGLIDTVDVLLNALGDYVSQYNIQQIRVYKDACAL